VETKNHLAAASSGFVALLDVDFGVENLFNASTSADSSSAVISSFSFSAAKICSFSS
jgi:hypothetical protein